MTNSLITLPLTEKIGQLFFVGIPGRSIDEATSDLLNEVSPGGICLFSRNIYTFEQTRKLLDDIRHASKLIPFLSIDQEGGLVDRLRRLMGSMPAASKLRDINDAAELGAIVGESLSILGLNMDFAPVVDVADDDRSQFVNGLISRTFGSTKEDVVAMARTFIESLQQHSVLGCLKHFPGLGASNVDSHEELPIVEIEERTFEEVDLFPYRELFKAVVVPTVMVAHAAFPKHRLQERDQNGKLLPSSLSRGFITTLLRGELQYNGIVITDDLEMGAIIKNYGIGDACKMAINAGVDMLAICADPDRIRDGYQAVLTAVERGEIDIERINESLVRIETVKSGLPPLQEFNALRLRELSDRINLLNNDLAKA